MMSRDIMQRQMFAKGGAAFPDMSGDGRVTQKDILMGRGVIPMQEGGDPMAMAAMMPPQDPAAMMDPMAGGQAMDPEVVQSLLQKAQSNLDNIDEAEDYETVINSLRGDDAPIEARYAELAELVGPEDAQQTPESVLALVQPAIIMNAVDQGIGGLAAEEMTAPVEGAMAEGIMSTVAPPPQPEMMAAPPAAPGPMMDPAMMGGPPPVNFNQGGLVRRGDNQPVQYFAQGGETLADFQKMLGLNITSPQNLTQASSQAGTIPAYEPTYDERVLSAAKGAEARYAAAGLGTPAERAAELEEQKNLTQAQMFFDVAGAALAYANPTQAEIQAGRSLSPAERLAAAVSETKLLPTIGARAQQQLEYKKAANKEERALKLAAVQRGETQVDKEDAAASALAVKKAEMAGKRYKMGPDDVLTDTSGKVLFEGKGGTINVPEGGTVINKKTGAVVATGADKLYNLSPGTKLVDATGATISEGKGQTVSVAPGTKIVNTDTQEVIAEGILPAVKGIPRDVWNTLSSKAKQSILDNPSVNGIPASIFTQLDREDQNIILKITSNNVKGIPRALFNSLTEDDQAKIMGTKSVNEERIKDIPRSIFENLPEAVRNSILGATQVLSSDQRIVSVEDGSVIAEAAPKPIYKTVNNQLVVIDPKTNGVTPLFGTAQLPEADYMQLTVNGVTTVVDKNTQKGRDALTAANALNAKTPGSAQFNTISSAQKPPTPKGFLVRNKEGDRVGIFTSYDGKSYVNEEGKIVPLDSNDVPVSDTITYDVLKGESVRTNANDQLIELDEKIISSLTDDKGDALAGGAREEVRNALKQARLGTGFWSSVYAGIDNVLGGVVAPDYFSKTFQNTQDARQFTRMVGILGRSALAASPRFAVADLNLTMTLFPDPASFLANPATEARKLIPLSQELSNERRRILTAIRDVPDMPSTQKATLNQKLYEINRLTELLGPVLALNTMPTSTSISSAVEEAAALQSDAVKAGKSNN